MEEKSRKRKKRADMQRVVLQTIGTAGFITAALLAPNVLGALNKLGFMPHRRYKDSIYRARSVLVQRGYLRWEGGSLGITEDGKKKLSEFESKNYNVPKPERWDGRWRVLIFDIPEKRKGLRNKVRETLKLIGFMRLQNSVWIYPYDCEELISLLKADFKIGKAMLYMIVDTLEYDLPVRSYFSLE